MSSRSEGSEGGEGGREEEGEAERELTSLFTDIVIKKEVQRVQELREDRGNRGPAQGTGLGDDQPGLSMTSPAISFPSQSFQNFPRGERCPSSHLPFIVRLQS